MRRLRLLLDANVLVDALVRDLFLTLAEDELIDIRWSEPILDEVEQALQRLGVPASGAQALRLTVSGAFPEAASLLAPLPQDLLLPDPGDHHVLAAAVASECDLIVTFNVRDFPADVLGRFDLGLAAPDLALLDLVEAQPERVAAAVETILRRMSRPIMSIDAWLERLERVAPYAAQAIGAIGFKSPGWQVRFQETGDALGDRSPQRIVEALIRAIVDETSVFALLASPDVPTDELRDEFAMRTGEISTSRIPLGPGREAVAVTGRSSVAIYVLVEWHEDRWLVAGAARKLDALEER
jgi:predicted nucleic acid-binding protein